MTCIFTKRGPRMDRSFEAARIDMPALAEALTPGSGLTINTIRKADLKRLKPYWDYFRRNRQN